MLDLMLSTPIATAQILLLLWCAVALACGGFIKGALGVGTPLLTVPLLALVLPPQTAVVLIVAPVVVANLWQAARAPRVENVYRRFWPVALAILAGTAVGTVVLARIDQRALLLIVGSAVIAFAVLQATTRQMRIPAHREKSIGLGFGLCSGLVGGVSSFFGPILIMYLTSLPGLTKDGFVGAISFLYLSAVLPWAAALYWSGILTHQLLLYSLAATAPVLLGMALGRRLRRFISERRFQRLMVVVLMSSGGVILWRTLN